MTLRENGLTHIRPVFARHPMCVVVFSIQAFFCQAFLQSFVTKASFSVTGDGGKKCSDRCRDAAKATYCRRSKSVGPFDQRDRVAGDSLFPADEAEPFAGLGFDIDAGVGDAEIGGNARHHGMNMRRHFRPLRVDG